MPLKRNEFRFYVTQADIVIFTQDMDRLSSTLIDIGKRFSFFGKNFKFTEFGFKKQFKEGLQIFMIFNVFLIILVKFLKRNLNLPKVVIRFRKLKKNRQHNDQKKKVQKDKQ